VTEAIARRPLLALIAIGVLAGYLSGLFGVGGGVVVVPLLMLLGVDQRLAAGTSTAAILPTAVVGAISYGVTGHVDWLAAALIAVGVVVGAQLGTWLLARLPREVLFWSFLAFLVVVGVSLWLVVPQRDAVIGLDVLTGALLVAVGVLTGVLSGLMGVGGGIILVPILMFFFGASDLVAKGTSLAMMVPGSISGTVGNLRRGNVDLRMAAAIGIAACIVSPLGALTAQAISPFVSNAAFSLLIVFAAWQLIQKHLKARRAARA
jgi:uncharacterized membrane protein YfcA